MTIISNKFHKEDIVKTTIERYSETYDKIFPINHEFKIIDIIPSGLVLEDREGLLLMEHGFNDFEIVKARGNYIDNENGGWYSNRPN